MIASNYARYLASKEARDIMMDRRKITESERSRLREEKQLIPIDQVAMALYQIGESIKAHVPEEKAKQFIYNDVMRILGSFRTYQGEFYGRGTEYDD